MLSGNNVLKHPFLRISVVVKLLYILTIGDYKNPHMW